MTIIPHFRLGAAAPSQDDTLLPEHRARRVPRITTQPCVWGRSCKAQCDDPWESCRTGARSGGVRRIEGFLVARLMIVISEAIANMHGVFCVDPNYFYQC